MSAAAAIITSACLGMYGTGNEACSKFLEASMKQYGVYDNIEKQERILQEETVLETRLFLGEKKFKIVGASVFLTKTIADRSITFKLPTFGLCDSITSKAGVDIFNLKIEWSF